MSESSIGMFGSKKSVKLNYDTYYLLKRVAHEKGIRPAEAVEEAIRRYCLGPGAGDTATALQDLQDQVRQLQKQMNQIHSPALPNREAKDTASGDRSATKRRDRGRAAIQESVMSRVKSSAKSRRTDPSERLAFLGLVFDSKPKKGWSRDVLQECAGNLWAQSIKHECFSWGVVEGDLEDSLDDANAIDRRQRGDFLDLRGGDIIVATWGKVVLGWGFVKPNPEDPTLPSYRYRDPDLASLWKKKGEWYTDGWQGDRGWFQHTVRVDWQQEWDFGEVSLPRSIPAQPTLRRPRRDREESWQVIRDLGIPIDNHGVVTA